MPDKTEISDWDLLAYADGRLEPARAHVVEAALAEDPDLRAKVADFARQNAALAAQYDAYMQAPLPERLARLLDDAPPRRAGTRGLRRVAAMLLAVLGAGAAGWYLGDAGGNAQRDALAGFLDEAAAIHQRAAEGRAGAVDLASAPDGRPLNWFSDRVSLELKVPDLRDEGYALVDKRRVTLDGVEGVYLRYLADESQPLAVFLRSRWTRRPSDVDVLRREGVDLAYWMDGPLSVVVASEGPGHGAEIKRLAAMLRARLHDRNDGTEGTGGELAPHRGGGVTRETVTPVLQSQQVGDVTGGEAGRVGEAALDRPVLEIQR